MFAILLLFNQPGALDDESLLPFGSATGSVALKTV